MIRQFWAKHLSFNPILKHNQAQQRRIVPANACGSQEYVQKLTISFSPTAGKLARDLKRNKGIRSAANFMATFDPRPSRQ